MNVIDELKKFKKIAVYGAGNVGKVAVGKMVSFYPNPKVECVVVTDCENSPYHIYGIPVISIRELNENMTSVKSEWAVLVATLETYQEEIKKTLLKYGFDNIYFMKDELYVEWQNETQQRKIGVSYSTYLKRYIEPCLNTVIKICKDYQLDPFNVRQYVRQVLGMLNSEKPVIARLVVVLGTKCSLRCKECNNLIPHFSPQFDLNSSQILNSLKIVLEKTETVLCCELVGGEPFLSKNLGETLQFLLENEKVGHIEITTNGKTMPEAAIIPLLKNNRVMVRISDYGTLVDKKKIVLFLEENAIQYKILKSMNWISAGDAKKRGRNKEQLEKYYENCSSGYYCKTLYGNKIFACARAASLYALKYMKEEEYICVNENLIPQEIEDFILKDYSESCDYCDLSIENIRYIKPAEQL